MRQIFLDTETTGLYHAQGHRIIEIAGVEVINRRLTNNHFHVYINPERDIDAGAQEVHGITLEFLQDKPKFSEVVDELIQFIHDSELVIHNAPFDIGFLNAELGLMGRSKVEGAVSNIVDTLKMAKEMRPGQRNNLDALCRHFGIDNSKRTLHGALLDAELLADVYLAMTRGQDSLIMDMHANETLVLDDSTNIPPSVVKVLYARSQELTAHQEYVESLSKSKPAIWKNYQDS